MKRWCTVNFIKKNVGHSGFTIVELLVVIVVIGILASITIISYTGISNKASIALLQSDLSNASKQIKIYQTVNGAYPILINDCPSPAVANICIKFSGNNNLVTYNYNNNGSQTFNLSLSNGSNYYAVNNESSPAAVDKFWTGLVAYWNLNNTANDISGRGFNGTWYGSSSHYVAGKVGSSAGQFLAANGDNIGIGSLPSYSNTNETSYAFWNIPTGVGIDYAVITYAGQLCQSSTSVIKCWVNTANQAFTYSRAASGSWEHVVVTISFITNQMKIYVDGQIKQTDTITVTKNNSSWTSAFIGQYTGGVRRFSGSLDDIRVYDRILSDQEVTELYDSTN